MNALLLIGWLAGAHPPPGAPCPTLTYARIDSSTGILIKVPQSVDSLAVESAKRILRQMLGRRADIRKMLADHHAALAIIPRACYITSLPEFARFSGKKDPNGNAYDSFAVRGAGGVPGQPVTAISEENLLKRPDDPFHAESITHHEFAHAIMNLGFTEAERTAWRAIYKAAAARHLFPGAFAMTNADEYWAELSQSYFSVNNEINGPALIQDNDAAAAAFLAKIYGRLPEGPAGG